MKRYDFNILNVSIRIIPVIVFFVFGYNLYTLLEELEFSPDKFIILFVTVIPSVLVAFISFFILEFILAFFFALFYKEKNEP